MFKYPTDRLCILSVHSFPIIVLGKYFTAIFQLY